MNFTALLAHLPTSTWIAFVVSVVLPALSALLVKAHWDSSITGVLTVGLSTAAGFFTEWAHAGDGFRWQTAAAVALGSWVIAALSQSKILAGTQLEAWLLTLGSKISESDPALDSNEAADADPTLGLDDGSGAAASPTPADPGQPAAAVPLTVPATISTPTS